MPSSLVCIDCHSTLDLSTESEIRCLQCGRTYPVTFGIPDMRGDHSSDDRSDQMITRILLEHYADTDFAGMLELRNRHAPTAADLRGHEVGYVLTSASRGRDMTEMFQRRSAEYYTFPRTDAALDLGCGTGAGLQALAPRFRMVVGIDPSLPDLILARKSLDIAGIDNVQLIQGYGQKVPYPSGSFDYINALNVLEHVFDLPSVLAEVHRLLKPAGIFSADSRNRFDPFFPEPHVKIRWVGFMPRKYAERYVRWRAGVAYNHTYLFSYGELRYCARQVFGKDFRIVFPYVSAYGISGRLDPWLRRLERLPVVKTLALWVFPSHLLLVRRSEVDA